MEKEEKKGLRMKELMEETGLPKSTILHYVAQGLLPEPLRTGKNMAYYDASCIERARFIKKVQGTYAFPLEKIKKMLAAMDEGEDITPFVELDAVIFGTTEGREMDLRDFQEATGLTTEQVSELLEANLLLPLKEGWFKQEDIDAGRAFAASFARGLMASDFAFYARLAKEVVDQEMRLRQRLTGHLPDGQDARVTAELTRGARALRNYIVDRVFQRRVAAARTLKDEALLS
jgi:DNA-binding transcriptional MerR regulator